MSMAGSCTPAAALAASTNSSAAHVPTIALCEEDRAVRLKLAAKKGLTSKSCEGKLSCSAAKSKRNGKCEA